MDINLNDLIAIVRHNKGKDTESRDQAAYREAERKMTMITESFENASEDTNELVKNSPVRIDPKTAFMMTSQLKNSESEGDRKLYDILVSDISNANEMINRQIRETYPKWAWDYILKDIDVDLFIEDVDWREYVYRNKFDDIKLPGCCSAIIPICLRFRKDYTDEEIKNRSWGNEIRFLDVLCMMGEYPIKVSRVQMLHCGAAPTIS